MNIQARFHLNTMPFTREISVEHRFRLSFIDQEYTSLHQAIENRMSGALIAPAGTGKTLLLRTLAKSLPEARYRVHYIKVTDLSKRDMCRQICSAIGAKPAATYPALVRSIQNHFSNSFDHEGIRPVILVDEGHELKPSVLSMFRLLTNFEMDSKLVVSVIFMGQSPLKELLQKDELEDIAKRLAHCGELRLLSRDESLAYLKHRIKVAGSTTFPFDEGACEFLFELSRGNIRALGQLARKSMEIASLQNCNVIDQNHITAARANLSYS